MTSGAAAMIASPLSAGGARERRTLHLADAAFVSLAVLVGAALKQRFANANAEDLGWLLAPATRLVESMTGQTFVHEARVGFVAERLPIVIAPACAGLNYVVIALLTLVVGFVTRFSTTRAKARWFAASLVFAYLATLVANTIRIATAVGLHEMGFRTSVFSPAEIHRALGVGVYLASLWIVYSVTDKALRKAHP